MRARKNWRNRERERRRGGGRKSAEKKKGKGRQRKTSGGTTVLDTRSCYGPCLHSFFLFPSLLFPHTHTHKWTHIEESFENPLLARFAKRIQWIESSPAVFELRVFEKKGEKIINSRVSFNRRYCQKNKKILKSPNGPFTFSLYYYGPNKYEIHFLLDSRICQHFSLSELFVTTRRNKQNIKNSKRWLS